MIQNYGKNRLLEEYVILRKCIEIVNPKCPECFLIGAMCRFCSANLSNLDIKYNNLSFGDPDWLIPIGEETLEPYIQISEEKISNLRS